MAGQPDPASNSAVYYPSDMLGLYQNMKFSVGGEPVSIAVNAYRNNDSGSHPTAADGGTQDALSIKDALAGMSGDVHSRAGGAVSYVDDFIGLDCNGFVGNWLKRVDHSLLLGPQQGPRDVYNKRRIVRKTVQEIAYC